MLPQNLPSIERNVSDGADLRFDSAAAISFIEVQAGRSASGKASAALLRDFFIACANGCNVASGNVLTTVKLA